MKVLIVDDHLVILDGLKSIIPQDTFQVHLEAYDAETALHYIRQFDVDLVITDIQLPGMSGIELIREARKIKTGIKFIVLSMFEEQDLVKEAMDAGADAYIVKSSAPEQLIRALKKVSAGKKYLCEDLAYAFWNENNKKDQLKPVITEREKEVLRHILDEKSNKQIAECMFISERTVESHRKNLYRKTNSDTLVGLVKYAIDHKLT